MEDNKVSIDFRFAEIQILNKSLHYIPLAEEEFKFFYQINAEARVRPDAGVVVIMVTANIRAEDEKLLASITAVFSFEIVEFEKHISPKENGKYSVPDDLEQLFKQVSMSTMRGIMYSELRGTYLNGAIMPVIFPHQLNKVADGSVSLSQLMDEQKEKSNN